MEVTDALIDELAQLARLSFNPAEKITIRRDLQRMIAFVEKLGEVDTEGVSPLIHITEQYNVLREDTVRPSISREEGLQSAPQHNEQFFRVPKVIKK